MPLYFRISLIFLLLVAVLSCGCNAGEPQSATPAKKNILAEIDAAFAKIDKGEEVDLPEEVEITDFELSMFKGGNGSDIFNALFAILEYWKKKQGGLFDREYKDARELMHSALPYLIIEDKRYKDIPEALAILEGKRGRNISPEDEMMAREKVKLLDKWSKPMDNYIRTLFSAYGVGYHGSKPGALNLKRIKVLLTHKIPVLIYMADLSPSRTRFFPWVATGYSEENGELYAHAPVTFSCGNLGIEYNKILTLWGKTGWRWAALYAVRGADEELTDDKQDNNDNKHKTHTTDGTE